jgi:hypothetical protein
MKKKIFILMLTMCGFVPYAKSQTIGDYNLLIVDGTFGSDAQSELTAMGHTVFLESPANLTPGYDYTPYDAIIFMYNTYAPIGMSEILALNQNCQLGLILMRGENIISPADMGTSVTFSNDDLLIENNTHYITQPFSLGLLDLGFTYKSNLTTINSGNTILGSVSGGNGSLVIHNTYKRVMSPYYGHYDGMPWNPDAEILMDRIIAWAVSPCCTANTGIDVITSCNPITWIDGNTYTTSNNTATHIIPNAAGCDSVITLNLTINNASSSTDNHTTCDSYTWIDGNTYTTSNNTATHLLTNAAGCDSTVTLNLTINNVSDITTTTSGITIISNNSTATYKWLDCNNSFAEISGETGQSYTPLSNGSYAVELTENGCVDTTICVSILNVGIVENSFGGDLFIYPNPTNGNFTIDLGAIYENSQISITNILGGLIVTKVITHSQVLNLAIKDPAGIYIISVQSGDRKAVFRLIKE